MEISKKDKSFLSFSFYKKNHSEVLVGGIMPPPQDAHVCESLKTVTTLLYNADKCLKIRLKVRILRWGYYVELSNCAQFNNP